jgi:hypothetical protein
MLKDNRQASAQLSFNDAVAIWVRIIRGEFLNRIAADYDVNPGRISEIKTGRLFAGAKTAAHKIVANDN